MMTDAERVWMTVTGRASEPADVLAVMAIEAIILEGRSKVVIEDKVRRLVAYHLHAVQDLHDMFNLDAQYLGLEADCECQCHTWSDDEADR